MICGAVAYCAFLFLLSGENYKGRIPCINLQTSLFLISDGIFQRQILFGFFIDFFIPYSFRSSPMCFEFCQVFSFIQGYELYCQFFCLMKVKFFICFFKKVSVVFNFIPAEKIPSVWREPEDSDYL